ncbi:hypothetical protein [Aeromonas salmonicida]|uniref:hypothetical protein n=1 Tax=Aeromonas salmonicida TaxID=645 RepID=UPI00117978BC|nr:hypothetical protein [Aeromonas salmonicida]ORJ11999.1 hypothetical protein A7D02_13245 [Aeromonas salmonicida]ORJ17024.1 hypothetical protein A7D03_10575 [Aeromonas salmonicida]WCH32897.1 hypothetical protein ONZ67_07335 [Aeromonas salmonicida]WCH37107.1 hypothetical protein ONZ60_07400 [Aeromonas salmonicida]WGI37818.1 hypothetical protein QDU35_15720 [Aeromonas salmonicida]
MSDAIKIARQAPGVIEELLTDMFAAKAEDNCICLGGVYSGQQYIQIQLAVTSNPANLMDEDYVEDDCIGQVGPSQDNPLAIHWLTARAEFIVMRATPSMREGELLALGAIRAVYWLALGQGDTPLATDIGDWWEECATLHGLGEVIL